MDHREILARVTSSRVTETGAAGYVPPIFGYAEGGSGSPPPPKFPGALFGERTGTGSGPTTIRQRYGGDGSPLVAHGVLAVRGQEVAKHRDLRRGATETGAPESGASEKGARHLWLGSPLARRPSPCDRRVGSNEKLSGPAQGSLALRPGQLPPGLAPGVPETSAGRLPASTAPAATGEYRQLLAQDSHPLPSKTRWFPKLCSWIRSSSTSFVSNCQESLAVLDAWAALR